MQPENQRVKPRGWRKVNGCMQPQNQRVKPRGVAQSKRLHATRKKRHVKPRGWRKVSGCMQPENQRVKPRGVAQSKRLHATLSVEFVGFSRFFKIVKIGCCRRIFLRSSAPKGAPKFLT